MKQKLLYVLTLLSLTFINAQEEVINTTMGTGYSNQVFYKLSTQTETSVAANSWDIAMLRTSAFDIGIRVNDGIGIEVFEASNNPADWNTIDIANEGSWTQLYNSETVWAEGAFQKGSATYGWGEYNPGNHHVVGTVIFVLKYADGSYIKYINEDFFGAYTFKYSKWNASTSSWEADQTVTVSNSSNPNNTYNFYSLQNDQEVTVAPAAADWDFVFRRYTTELAPGVMYPVTGVLHSNNVTVAQNEEVGGMPANPSLTYSADINIIGSDWKSFNGAAFDVNSDMAYYVKYTDNTIYRIYFTAFAGMASGDLTFNFADVTTTLGIEEVTENVTFGMHPNPSTDGIVNLVYDVNKLGQAKNAVAVFSATGQKVFETALSNNSGFFNKTLDLSHLSGGIYMLQFTSGSSSVTKKLVIK